MEARVKMKGFSKMAVWLTSALLLVQLAVPGPRTFGSEAAKLIVFDDRLEASFHNNSWAGVSLDEEETVYEGSRSIRFEAGEGQAVYLYKERIMNASEYEDFSFWLRGSGQGGQSFKLVFTLGGQALAEWNSGDLLPGGIPTDEWVKVTVPLGGGNPGWMDGILVWGAGQQGPLFIDGLAFSGKAGGEAPGEEPGEQPGEEPGGEEPGGEEPGSEEPGGQEPGEPGDPIEPVAGFYLYDDKLADTVTNNSWGQVSLTESSVKRTGTSSIRFTPDGDGALYLSSTQLLTVNDYDKLRLWVHGGSEGGQQAELALTAGGVPAFEQPLEYWLPEGVPAGEWALIEMDLADLGLEHRLFDGIRLTGMLPGKQEPLYLDDISVTSRQEAQAAVLELRIDQPRLVMLPGERRQVQAETFLQSGDTAIVTGDTEWEVDRPELLSVEDGELVALQPGIAKITATHNRFTTEGFVQITNVRAETVYEDALTAGYRNYSWHEKDFANEEQARSGARSIKFEPDGWDGVWISGESKRHVEDYYGIRFWLHGGSAGGQELLFHVYDGNQSLGAIPLNELLPNGSLPAGQWTEVTVGMADLGLDLGFFDGLILQAGTEDDQGAVYIDDIALLANPNAGQLPEPELPLVTVSVDQTSERKPISNDIYGINYDEGNPTTSDLPFPVERWGGNQTTRYNWQLNAANRANDWFFINYPYDGPDWEPSHGSLSDRFIDRVLGRGNQVLMTIPTIGWTPKDRTVSYGFSQQKYGSQTESAWELRDAGNGVHVGGELVTNNDPSDTSVRVGTEFAADWVRHMAERSNGQVRLYALDNEPDLWHVTHRDVHPEAPTYDELWNKTVEYGTAIKQADPDAKLLGPVSWGWCGYFYSSADLCADGPDRQAHGGTPFLEWYLQQVRDHEQETGLQLIDYLTIHYYSQEQGVPSENESPQVAKRRFQALKSLYDDQFVDQSWIREPIRLIPRMKDIIERNRPGLKLAITEYNFGNGVGVTAGLAQAEALAIFGREGVDLATRFGNFQAGTPIEDAFKLYLNYDGQGSSIEGSSVRTDSSRADAVGAYTIEGNDGKTYVLLFNKDTLSRDIQLELGTGFDAAEVYAFDAVRRLAKTGDLEASASGTATLKLPKRSATLLVVQSPNSF
ncbi:glycoside hydrolase family 44 protein [Cohnella hongkongensis]|uniref:Glycoside hydrolase family 44 protein n=1 Tax=Cohnella hongkongensis TaxID=178337 RepID=A0ABV9F9E5_9BACL